ncbi:asialoglycoprotein receptor 2-like isoform X2 [Palaemon carinicauda]|uniref:asialoglycoprotein receptor 2-like isoform X2 n=1 Tax=Palaemon carinicauda TaxID=392227 RepID=UPI0035B57994
MKRSVLLFVFLGTVTFPVLGGNQECPLPFAEIGGHCIYIDSVTAGSWYDMNKYCENLNSHPVKLDDLNLFHDIVVDIKTNHLTNAHYWIGARDEGHEGEWRWTDGSNVRMGTPFWGYVQSISQQPEGQTSQNCAVLDWANFFYFNDHDCNLDRNIICQFN